MKTYSTALRDEFYNDRFVAVDLVELYLLDTSYNAATLRLCTGGFDVAYGGNTYTAQGDFIGFSSVAEDFDVKVGRFQIYLSAVGNNYVSKFVDTDFEGRRVVIKKAFLDIDAGTLAVIDAPIIIFDGQIYNISITESRSSSSISIDCATLFADFERTTGRKTNSGSNWLFQGSTADTCFEKSGFVGTTEFKWGRL